MRKGSCKIFHRCNREKGSDAARGAIYTELHSKIELGDEEEAMEAYILVRRVDDDEGNEAI